MKTYKKFIILLFLKSFFNIFLIMFSLALIINLFAELDFFKNFDVSIYYPLLMSFINSPALMFEMFPFIFLISTQLFFLNLFNNDEIKIFKYNGLKNSNIIRLISLTSFILGLFIITLFYNFSSNLKNIYLELKSNYTTDGKYLAVITKNGLWIKDKINEKTLIINASKFTEYYLIDAYISEFDQDFKIIKNISSSKINIKDNLWIIENPKIFFKNEIENTNQLKLETNFNSEKIKNLFSNLSSLSLMKLIQLKKNYKELGNSLVEINLQIQKILSYPIYLLLMTVLSSIIMFNSKKLKRSNIKIVVGLFICVIIYYVNNFFNVLGSTEKISVIMSIWIPVILIFFMNFTMLRKINEK